MSLMLFTNSPNSLPDSYEIVTLRSPDAIRFAASVMPANGLIAFDANAMLMTEINIATTNTMTIKCITIRLRSS